MARGDDHLGHDAVDKTELAGLDPAMVVARSHDQVSAELDGEVVLMNTATGDFFNMNDVASHIWSLLDKPRVAADIFAEIQAVYEVPSGADPQAETSRFLQRLVQLGIVVTDPSPA